MLFSALQTKDTRTANGMAAHSTTSDYCVDLFGSIGALRGKSSEQIIRAFEKAYGQEPLTAMKILFYSRNILGGQGERRTFRTIINHMAKNANASFRKNIGLVPSFGRWDDLLQLVDTPFEEEAFALIQKALETRNALAAKWMPRPSGSKENKYVANKLRRFMRLTPRQYRAILVAATDVIETKMCSKDYAAINYSHAPSVAANRYRTAFHRNDGERYRAYLEQLEKGTEGVKINAKAIFPHDIVKGYYSHNRIASNRDATLEAQWSALPNYMEGSTERLLPVCDVSGSMWTANGLPMLVSLTMGIYISERNEGIFKDGFMTFSSSPRLERLTGTSLHGRLSQLERAEWSMSTNLEATFRYLLNQARVNRVPADQMPTKLLIISDMQFNEATERRHSAMDMIRNEYATYGYELPQVIFWNVNESANKPVKFDENGTALVSGFSPSILKSILTGGKDLTPRGMMLKALSDPAYDTITA
jgi:hypothetical protein